MTFIITHRGLDPSKGPDFPGESTLEAFQDQLGRGFGLEFDVCFAKDGVVIALHDANLSRITGGMDKRSVSDVDSLELLSKNFTGGHLTTVQHILVLIRSQKIKTLSAIHIKGTIQDANHLNSLLKILDHVDSERILLFDLKPEWAHYIKGRCPTLQLATSVAHPYDIERYNRVVGGTLISLQDVVAQKGLFDWAWLDEWDLADKKGGLKTLYDEKTFDVLRRAGIKIALVTPELHNTSPGLLGGEAHPDASSYGRLMKRCKKILALQPDAVCTDYPDAVSNLFNQMFVADN